MDVFKEYSAYYDLLYKNKDYVGESRYVAGLLTKFGVAPGKGKSILDVGCGTGEHARCLAEMGYAVTGVDRSEDMIARAKRKGGGIEYCCGDAMQLTIGQKFDAVVSLFHVMSYQVTDDSINKVCKSVKNHLKPGGIFAFDFWHGPAVLNQVPGQRVLRVENDEVIIRRITTPKLDVLQNTVEINFEMWVQTRSTALARVFSEVHVMRYLFMPELRKHLSEAGFRVLAELKWMNLSATPDLSDRDAVVVAGL